MKNCLIFSGNSNHTLAEDIARLLELPLGQCQVSRFADGEVQIEINESVRGKDTFLIQSGCHPVNENYMELFLFLDALKRASAKSITAIIPYYGYARQDRKTAPRTPISAKSVARLLETSGVDRIVSIDLHSGQIQGFFNKPVDHLFATSSFAQHWSQTQAYKPDDVVVVSPDPGGLERARRFAKKIKALIAIVDKRRLGPNKAKAYNLIGDVENKVAVIFDDMIDTAGTLMEAANTLSKHQAQKVIVIATHGIFSHPAVDRIKENDSLSEIWITDTIPLKEELKDFKKIKVISIAPIIAEAIKRIYNHQSVTSLFD